MGIKFAISAIKWVWSIENLNIFLSLRAENPILIISCINKNAGKRQRSTEVQFAGV